MSEKYVVGSPQWLAALHAFMSAARPGMELSRDIEFCEVYTNVPASIPSDGGTVAFTVRFWRDSPEVEFELKEAERPNFKLRIDYAHVLPAARLVTDGDPAKQAALMAILGSAVQTGHASSPFRAKGLPVQSRDCKGARKLLSAASPAPSIRKPHCRPGTHDASYL